MNPLLWLSQLADLCDPIAKLLGALAIVFTAAHTLFLAVGIWWKPALRAASASAVIGIDLQKIAGVVMQVGAKVLELLGVVGSGKGGARGFVRLRLMLALVLVAGALLLACPQAAVAPTENLVACIASVVPGASSLAALVATAAAKCGADALAILDAIIGSTDPALAPYIPEAMATRGDPVKLAAFQNEVRARIAASQGAR